MISQIDIKNFKSLKDVSTDTKKLNLLMGLNGMGKVLFTNDSIIDAKR